MNFTRIHHIALICSDYLRSKHFYTQILALNIIAETYRAERDSYKLDLELQDGLQLELFSFPNRPPRPSYPEALGLRHLSFGVKSVEDAVVYLNQNGIATEAIAVDNLTSKKYTFFSDPDGLPLELYELSAEAIP